MTYILVENKDSMYHCKDPIQCCPLWDISPRRPYLRYYWAKKRYYFLASFLSSEKMGQEVAIKIFFFYGIPKILESNYMFSLESIRRNHDLFVHLHLIQSKTCLHSITLERVLSSDWNQYYGNETVPIPIDRGERKDMSMHGCRKRTCLGENLQHQPLQSI